MKLSEAYTQQIIKHNSEMQTIIEEMLKYIEYFEFFEKLTTEDLVGFAYWRDGYESARCGESGLEDVIQAYKESHKEK